MKKALLQLPPLNRYPSRREWEKACWRKIIKSVDLLEFLIAPSERRNLVMRAAAADLINSGKKYREVSNELWLSPQTISSIKKAMREKNYRSYWERGKTERKKKVYSRDFPQTKKKPHGRQVRTKYGVVRLPY